MTANYKTTTIITAVQHDPIISNLLECYFDNLPAMLGVTAEECEDSQCHAVRFAMFKLAVRVRPMLAHAAWIVSQSISENEVTTSDCYTALKWLYDNLEP